VLVKSRCVWRYGISSWISRDLSINRYLFRLNDRHWITTAFLQVPVTFFDVSIRWYWAKPNIIGVTWIRLIYFLVQAWNMPSFICAVFGFYLLNRPFLSDHMRTDGIDTVTFDTHPIRSINLIFNRCRHFKRIPIWVLT
jgi:hypothetical protein